MNHHDKVEAIGCLIGFVLIAFPTITILMTIAIVILSVAKGM